MADTQALKIIWISFILPTTKGTEFLQWQTFSQYFTEGLPVLNFEHLMELLWKRKEIKLQRWSLKAYTYPMIVPELTLKVLTAYL